MDNNEKREKMLSEAKIYFEKHQMPAELPDIKGLLMARKEALEFAAGFALEQIALLGDITLECIVARDAEWLAAIELTAREAVKEAMNV